MVVVSPRRWACARSTPTPSWVKPNVRTSTGSVCAVYYPGYEDKCLLKDEVSVVPVTEVEL